MGPQDIFFRIDLNLKGVAVTPKDTIILAAPQGSINFSQLNGFCIMGTLAFNELSYFVKRNPYKYGPIWTSLCCKKVS